jgi:shikimate kinase
LKKLKTKRLQTVFAEKGEAYFREKENEILKSFSRKNNFILSTGGGAPCFYDNIEWMNKHGITIWIDEPPATIAKRLQKEKSHRPLIANVKDEALTGFFVQMREKRKSFYSKAKYHLTGSDIIEESLLKIISPNE